MKRWHILIALAVVVLAVFVGRTGFVPKKIEISTMHLVEIMAIDKGQNPLEIAILKDPPADPAQQAAANEGEGQETKNAEHGAAVFAGGADGTFSRLEKQLRQQIGKEVFFGNVDIYLIGEEYAKNGLFEFFDYIMRHKNFNLAAEIFIVKDGLARDFLEKITAENIKLSQFIKSGNYTGGQTVTKNANVSLLNYISAMEKDLPFSANIIPTIKLSDTKVEINSFGVISQSQKLVGLLEGDAMTGYNIMRNQVKEDDISTEHGAAKITSIRSNINFKNNKFNVRVRYRATVENENSDISLAINTEINNKINQTLNKMEEFDADFLGTYKRYRARRPTNFREISDNYIGYFASLERNFDIGGRIDE
jgi:hypothetical protein